MGEFEFIEAIRRSFEGIGDGGITGIGDDCAVIPLSGSAVSASEPGSGPARASGSAQGAGSPEDCGAESFVVTTDMLIEDVHFLRRATSARELGAKSLAVNLSDIAAMGAGPVASFLSIALPVECRGEWAVQFIEGYRELSARYGVVLAGGDTTASKCKIAINVTAIGRALNSRLKFRSGARPGDIIVVNGPLGESAAGLHDILQGRLDTGYASIHRNPIPQVAEGEWLGARPEVHAMMDLSDGLASDLVHILRASSNRMSELPLCSGRNGVPSRQNEVHLRQGRVPVRTVLYSETTLSAKVELTAIPAPAGVKFAVTGGEDYKLLFTVAPSGWEALRADYRSTFGTKLYAIGSIEADPALSSATTTTIATSTSSGHSSENNLENGRGIIWTENNFPVTKNWHGFVHF